MSAVDAVVIGRNEGARLRACLASLRPQVRRVVYVDSGSTDDSVATAREVGAEVVTLDMDRPFTAARARNAGFEALGDARADFVQFVDGDCVVDPNWVATGLSALQERAELALVCGRRRELAPEASIYNHLCDIEWDTAPGEATFCGGDALIRSKALQEVGGYDASLIAGEEPEMCLRLRRAGWRIWRLEAEMTGHDADMHRFSQWWKRSKRAGHAFAEGAARHGQGPERYWVAETRRAILWGAVLPLVILCLVVFATPWALLLGLLYPAQMLRMMAAGATPVWAVFTTFGKFAEAQGALGYWLGRASGRRKALIEYK